MVTSPHDPLGITDSSCKNQLVVVSVQYGPFNPYIPIRSTTIDKSRVAIDPIAMHTSWRSNSDIPSVTSGESSTTMHRLLHASGSHPIPPPNDPNYDSFEYTISDEITNYIKGERTVLTERAFRRKEPTASNAIICSNWKESMITIESYKFLELRRQCQSYFGPDEAQFTFSGAVYAAV
ncbi:ABC transporter B family member 21-like [Dorcoceras hygrometricum]|uniref:ABC transporter B family member 21-like n=1 Tax=Dorcoceras hygrometricum TaxID=472368 RepID=A0A2Z7C4J2_9LAMI|nr:ABC transporter B family member 21-like [Dorcoceras hygrometricum]